MRAARYHAFQAPLQIETLPDPTPPEDGVVVAVRASGICRSDWHGWQGHDGDIKVLPHTPGHELAGEIAAVGKDVKQWKIGDRVTVPFSMGCGTCRECISGNQQICDNDFQPGFHGPGSFAEYVALPHADLNLVRVPEAMSFVDVASLGCRFVTAYRALVAQAKVNAGEWVVIHGCGGVGLSAVMIAESAGAQVIAVDINEDALQLAAAVGATHLIDASETTEQELIDLTHDLSDGGAHVAMDALGSRITLRNSILSLRKRGRHVQVGLFGGDEADPAVPMGAVISKELEIYGSHGMQAHAYPPMLRQIASGTLKPELLVGQRVKLSAAGEVLADMGNHNTTGIVVIDDFQN